MYWCCRAKLNDILSVSRGPIVEVYEQNLFSPWGATPRLRINQWLGQNPLLCAKLRVHLRTAAHAKSPMNYYEEYQSLVANLATDYEVKSLEHLLEKYKLSGKKSWYSVGTEHRGFNND